MIKLTQHLTSNITKHIASYALIMLLASVVGCAELQVEDTGSPWVPATAQIEQSLGVSNWYVETLEGTTRIIGYDQSDIQLSELRISSPVLNEVQTLTYELHVTNHTRLVITRGAVIENTLSDEPRGNEWFDAMVNVPSLVSTGSTVDKSVGACIGQEAGMEIASIICDIANGGSGHPADYVKVCMAIWGCLSSDYNNDTRYASNNTGSTGYNDTWSSNSNSNDVCYDSWGNTTSCQNNYQNNNQNNECYDSWGYPVSCDIW